VEFIAPNAEGGIDMRVWERGVGETLSCGTGVCAAAAVARRRGLVGDETTVRVPGGELSVTLGESVLLGGPVVHVFDTEVHERTLPGSSA
jgi:diaminopimelate epimerase